MNLGRATRDAMRAALIAGRYALKKAGEDAPVGQDLAVGSIKWGTRALCRHDHLSKAFRAELAEKFVIESAGGREPSRLSEEWHPGRQITVVRIAGRS